MEAYRYTHWTLSLINFMVVAIIGKVVAPRAPATTDQVQSFRSMATASDENNKKELEAPFLKALKEHRGIIIKICRVYCNTRADEEDLYQEIVCQLWQDYPSFLGAGHVSSWMYKVAMRIAILPFRSRSKKVKIEFREELPDQVAEDDSTQADDNERLLKLLNRLTRYNRTILALIMTGYDKKEIALILDLEVETVKKRITRIKEKAKKL